MGQANALSEMAEIGGSRDGLRPGERLIPVDAEVLSDLRHSIGNYFHKLYYWADCVKSGEDLGVEVEPAEMLDRTLQSLEAFLRIALEYFRQPELSLVDLDGEELGRTLASVLRSEQGGAAEVVTNAKVERWRVAIDPARFSEALAIAVRQLRAASVDEARRLRGSVEVSHGSIALDLRWADPEIPPATTRDPGVVEWAVAERILCAHGGSLQLIRSEGILRGCSIQVPARTVL